MAAVLPGITERSALKTDGGRDGPPVPLGATPPLSAAGPESRETGDAHGGEAPPKPVKLQPSLFPHREPTVYVEYAPFVGTRCSRNTGAIRSLAVLLRLL